MAQSTTLVPTGPVATCKHKTCSDCATAWNVCCDCLFSDSQHARNRNLGDLPPLHRGNMRHKYCASCNAHWDGRVSATNDYPRVLEVIPSHPAILPRLQGGANGRRSHSSSARRKFRRAVENSTRMPLPDDDIHTRFANAMRGWRERAAGDWSNHVGDWDDDDDYSRAAGVWSRDDGDWSNDVDDWSRAAGGDVSATSIRGTIPPAAENAQDSVGLSGGIIAGMPPSVITSSVPIQLSPAEQRERFKRFTDARTKHVQRFRLTQPIGDQARLPQTSELGQGLRVVEDRPSIPAVTDTSDSMDNWRSTDSMDNWRSSDSMDNWRSSYFMYNWGFRSMLDRPTGPQAGGRADVSALESSWAPMPPHDLTAEIDTWDREEILLSVVPDPSNIIESAHHASRLLDAFSTSATPPVAGALTTTQQHLLSTALSSIVAITQHSRVDDAVQTDPLPPPVDVSMRPDATCVVCFARLVDTVLVPCWHLVLCAECCAEMKRRAKPAAMLCPVCRRVVRKTPKIFRS